MKKRSRVVTKVAATTKVEDKVVSKDGKRVLPIEVTTIRAQDERRPYTAIEPQVGGVVDLDCARVPRANPGGTYFGSPTPSAAIVTDNSGGQPCVAVTNVEILGPEYESWKRRLAEYISYDPKHVLQIDSAWVCSSSGRWYGSIPGFKTRGANKTGFIRTKPVDKGLSLLPLGEFLMNAPDMPGSAYKIASAITNWDPSKWEVMEHNFMVESGLREFLVDVATTRNGRVPMKLYPGSVGIIKQIGAGGRVRCVLMPTLSSEIQLVDVSAGAIDDWVLSVMRDMWIDIVSDMEMFPGLTAYKPTSTLVNGLKVFAIGAAVGGVAGVFRTAMVRYGLGPMAPNAVSYKAKIANSTSSFVQCVWNAVQGPAKAVGEKLAGIPGELWEGAKWAFS